MTKVKFTTDAVQDLEQIGDYIKDTLKNPKAALNTIGKIKSAVDKLKAFPLIGSPLTSAAGEETDYRFLVCGNYPALYRVQADIVYIDRVLYGKRDYMAILFGGSLESQPDTEE